LRHGDTREDPGTEVNIAGPAFQKLTDESKIRAEIAIGRRLAAPVDANQDEELGGRTKMWELQVISWPSVLLHEGLA